MMNKTTPYPDNIITNNNENFFKGQTTIR